MPNAVAPVTIAAMKQDKVCKGSVRYATQDENAPVATVYVSKSFAKPMPESINVTIEAAD